MTFSRFLWLCSKGLQINTFHEQIRIQSLYISVLLTKQCNHTYNCYLFQGLQVMILMMRLLLTEVRNV